MVIKKKQVVFGRIFLNFETWCLQGDCFLAVLSAVHYWVGFTGGSISVTLLSYTGRSL